MISKQILLITVLNECEFIFCTQLNGFKYCYLIRIILFPLNHLFANTEIVSRIDMWQ